LSESGFPEFSPTVAQFLLDDIESYTVDGVTYDWSCTNGFINTENGSDV